MALKTAVDAARFDPNRAALLLVDLQREFLHPDGALAAHMIREPNDTTRRWTDLMLMNCSALAQAAAAHDVPVISVSTVLRADHRDSGLPRAWFAKGLGARSTLVRGTWGAEAIDGLELPHTTIHLTKRGLSAFQHTELDLLLHNLGVRHLLVTGGAVSQQVSATVRQGAAYGYEQWIVDDAVYPQPAEDLVPLHNYATMMRTDEAVRAVADVRSTGVPRPAQRRRPALIVVDIQNDFVHPDGVMARYGYSKFTPHYRQVLADNVNRLATGFRRNNLPVLFVRIVQTPHGYDTVRGPALRRAMPVPAEERFIVEGTWGAEFYEHVRPAPADLEMVKRGNSAFGFTPLHRTLRNLGVDECIMVGGAVQGCISDSVREALGLGYDCTVVSDAVYPERSAYLKVLEKFAAIDNTENVLRNLETSWSASC